MINWSDLYPTLLAYMIFFPQKKTEGHLKERVYIRKDMGPVVQN